MSSPITYVGLKGTDLTTPGMRLRVSFRRVVQWGDVALEVISIGTATTGRDDFLAVAQRVVANLPGGGVAWCIAPPAIDAGQNVAVADLKLKSDLGTSTISEAVAAIEPYFAGTEVFRVAAVASTVNESERAKSAATEVATAVAADKVLDRSESIAGKVEKVGDKLKAPLGWAAVAVVVVLLLVVYVWRKAGK